LAPQTKTPFFVALGTRFFWLFRGKILVGKNWGTKNGAKPFVFVFALFLGPCFGHQIAVFRPK